MQYINIFLHKLKILIKEATILLPNDPNMIRTNKRVMLAIQYSPLQVVNTVGSYLYKYKDFVYNESLENSLLECKFETEVSLINNSDTESITKIIIDKLKLCLRNMDDNRKQFFRQLTVDLLDAYLEYQISVNNTN